MIKEDIAYGYYPWMHFYNIDTRVHPTRCIAYYNIFFRNELRIFNKIDGGYNTLKNIILTHKRIKYLLTEYIEIGYFNEIQ